MPIPTKEILVVDDDSSVRLMLRLLLQGAGYAVTEAGNGVAALSLVRDWIPDLVITDVSMPEMDGRELMSRVRAERRMAAMPILVLSGYSSGPEELQGASAFLAKPFDRKDLIRVVSSLMDESPKPSPV